MTKQRVKIFGKHMQSLLTDQRLKELWAEVAELAEWDAILLSETWREAAEEQFEADNGHIFHFSGGDTRTVWRWHYCSQTVGACSTGISPYQLEGVFC
jgi:hypothetical protein